MMEALSECVVNDDLRQAVSRLVDHCGSLTPVVDARWTPFAADVGLVEVDERASDRVMAVVVGTPAQVLHRARSTTADFAFVTPDAQRTKVWQRIPSWCDDTTLELWKLGWSPQIVERIEVPQPRVMLEFLVGTARRTPPAPDL